MTPPALAFTLAATLLAAAPAGRDQYQNPTNLDGYIAAQEDPDRAAWQKPDEVLDALGIVPGQVVCDIGAGPGYFTLRASRRVGARGRVFAVDVDPRILDALRTRLERAGARNVTPVLALASDPLLAPSSCDLVLVIDAYHHFPDRGAYLRRLVRLLRPHGRLVDVDWLKGDTRSGTTFGPPQEHRVSRDEFLADAARAGLQVVAEPQILQYQYFLILAARAAR